MEPSAPRVIPLQREFSDKRVREQRPMSRTLGFVCNLSESRSRSARMAGAPPPCAVERVEDRESRDETPNRLKSLGISMVFVYLKVEGPVEGPGSRFEGRELRVERVKEGGWSVERLNC